MTVTRRSLILLVIVLCTFLNRGKSCSDVCPVGVGWDSSITTNIRDARFIHITWMADSQSSLYVVQYRLRNTQVYTSSVEISSTNYNITQLSPETDYEVQVCRATSTSNTDDCGNCLFCISTTQAREPSSPPIGVQVRADSSESITVLWDEPESTNGGIRNYSVLCFHNQSQEIIVNETVLEPRPVSRFFLEPNSTYSCQVIAYNDYGASLAQQAVGTTLPVSTVASLLLVVYADGVEYAELTASAIQSHILRYERLLNTTEDTKIKGLDYHFYRKELYLTQNNHCITRVPVILDETTMLSSLRRAADPEVLFNCSADLGSIAVDWVNNELYWVEIHDIVQLGYRIMRAVINSDGSVVGPFCVVSFTMGTVTLTHLAIDPNRGYLYWSGSTAIYRAPLNSVRLNSTLESCASDVSSKVPLINNTQLETFTIEPNDAIYYVGFDSCFETSSVAARRTNRSILGTPLNAGAVRIYTGVAGSGPVISTDSFDRTLFSATDDLILVVDTSTVATCPAFPDIGVLQVRAPLLSLRTFRSVKQPLPVPPGPPRDILVSTNATEAYVTWKAPLFIGELFSNGAFANWIYILEIRSVRDSFVFENSVNTSALTFLFENLQPETLYEIVVSASGPGGNQTAQDRLVFSTKSADSANFTLLVASGNGVYSAAINGSSASQIGGQSSVESNGVAYDSYTGDYYWSVEGGQGRIYANKARGSPMPLFEGFRRNPFSLKLDWVARRLFWVEDGPTVRGPKIIVSVNLEDSSPIPESFAEVVNIQATVLDSLNGLLFWANESSIHAITLSGLTFESVCYTVSPGASPFGFAMDARRRRLYWLNDRDGGNLVVNQLEYTSTACDPNSIVAQDVVGLSFSSSSTVMVYAADNLFIGSLTDSNIYTIASDLSSVGDGQMLALGVIDLGISMTLGYRDLIVVSESLQVLPDALQAIDRRRNSLTPNAASSPPRLSDAATSLETVIEWDPSSLPSPIQNTPVFYTLQYSLLSSNEVINITSISTSATLAGIPPETTLTAMVTAYSLWYRSEPTQNRDITSRPALPGTVSNIRAYVYKPTRGSDDLTALVLWDEPQFVVSNYTVSMFLDGQRLYPTPVAPSLFSPPFILYQSPSADTHYIVSARDFENRVNYFLTPGRSYQIQIAANNPSGSGSPSPSFTLNVTGSDYPQNFLVVNDTGVHLAGVGAELNHALPPIAHPPLAVDTISRFVYWYLESSKSIARQSLNSASMDIQPYLLLPADADLLAMAFEWVGMDLYYMLRDQQNNLRIMRVSTVNRDVLARVGPILQEQVSPADKIKMVVDPFGGYLHWLVVSSAETSLHRMDLRNTSVTSRLTVQQSGSGLTDLRSLRLSSALLLDPQTGNLLLSDADSGDIVNCSVISETCSTLISASMVQPQPACGGTGLPALSIALNEQRLYWVGDSSSCTFAIEFNDPTNPFVVLNYSATDILTLSPGQQPLPTQDCLSPDVLDIQGRPPPNFLTETNTTVTMGFVSPPLEEVCKDVIISYPPVTFGIDVENAEQSIPGFPIFTVEMKYIVDGLLPFTEYRAELSISNMYTLRRHYFDNLFSIGERFMTSEGVPDSAIGVMSEVFGTADIRISWSMPDPLTLRGSESDETFYIQIFSNGTLQGEVQVNELSVFLNSSVGVVNGRVQNIVVIRSNTAVNSTGTLTEVRPWPLVPQPVPVNIKNTTAVVKVVLNNSELYEPITGVSVKICLSAQCDCSQATVIDQDDFKSVENATEWTFTFSYLQARVQYCVQSIGIYRGIEGFRTEPEVTNGESTSFMTMDGVPDPPVISLRPDMEDILEWTPPLSRGPVILFYTIEAVRVGSPTSNPEKFVTEATEIDLSTRMELIADVVYRIQVSAMNSIGESNSSNEVSYTRLQDGSVDAQTLAISIGSSVAGLFLIILCLIVVTVLSLSFHRRKKEPTSLSYMYGPDHELSNLRDAYRHAHANNPHYTWSRDDYICTDEEIELLNKFPRQNLKLETFIDRGEFGEVYQGCAMDILGPETGPTPVAVKTLRKGTTYEEQRKFLSEASLMSKFNHPNIVKVLGVCVDNDPVYIIMELMPAGDLLKFLRDAKRDHGPALLTLSEQVQVALDVAQGCRYLEQQHYIHRDIAARNCLVSSKGADRVVKIGDFGLARDLYSSDYYQVEGQRKLPVRWMAPEALLQGKFTTESDIWSYGVLLWEIMTLGNQPYPGRINQEVLQYVTGGGRLDRPEKCPGRIYHLMQSCWKRYSSDRPHFDQIVTIVTSFLERTKRPGSGYYTDSDSEDGDSNVQTGKLPSRTPSIRSGILNLARTGSMKLRNSFRRHGSVHRRDDHAVSQFSEESQSYRERGPF